MARSSSRHKKDATQSTQNAANTLLANIRFMSVDNPVHTMVVTSSVPNEGKTYVSANLARAIAASGKTVLLVECDMRRRSAASNLGVHAKKGLYAVVSGQAELDEAVVATDTENMHFLDAEPHIPNPSDLLNSKRFTEFMKKAKKAYDYVVFDTPPVVTFVDAAVLGAKADAVFVVVRENFARKSEVAAASEQLSKAGCNVGGIIMNYCERRGSEYYYEYYYRRDHNDSSAPKLNLSDVVNSSEENRASTTRENKAAVPSKPKRASKRTASTNSTKKTAANSAKKTSSRASSKTAAKTTTTKRSTRSK